MKRFLFCFLLSLASFGFALPEERGDIQLITNQEDPEDVSGLGSLDDEFLANLNPDDIPEPGPISLADGSKAAWAIVVFNLTLAKNHVLEHKYKYLVGTIGFTAATIWLVNCLNTPKTA